METKQTYSRAKLWKQTIFGVNFEPPKHLYTVKNPTYEEINDYAHNIDEIDTSKTYYWVAEPINPDAE